MIDQLVYDMETDILARIAYYLSRGAVASADWQTRKLSQLGALTKDAQAIINQYRARILLQTGKAVEESAEDILTQIRARTPKQLKTIAAMTPEMRSIIETWSGSAATKVNLAMAQLAQNAGSKYVAAVSKASLSVVTGTETLQRSVMQSIGELERLDAFVDKAGRTWTPEGYVKMVVRDNQRRASTATMFQAAAEGDTDLIEVSSHMGARPKCAPYQGRIFSISGTSEKYPALADTSYGEPDGLDGINCVLGDTLVSGPTKNAVYRRKYTGEIITIRTAAGNELSVTPNHPILSAQGWLPAHLLTVGCNVVSRASLKGVGGVSPNPDHREPAIKDVFDLFFDGGDVFRLPPSACNFHGDIPDHEVDIVFRNSFLRDAYNPARGQHVKQSSLGNATETPDGFEGVRSLDKAFIGSLHAPNGVMRGSGNLSAPIIPASFVDASHHGGLVFGYWDAEIGKIFPDGSLRYSDLISDFILPEAGVIEGEQPIRGKPGLSEEVAFPITASMYPVTPETIQDRAKGASVFVADLGGGDPGVIQLDNIIFIERKPAQSPFVHVYNLQTEAGWYYSNNIISHNCGHIFYPFWEGVSEKTYSPYKAAENRKAYEESQEQRTTERKIRHYKREAAKWGATEGGEQKAAYYQGRVKDAQAEMRELVRETGRTRQRDREQIYGQ